MSHHKKHKTNQKHSKKSNNSSCLSSSIVIDTFIPNKPHKSHKSHKSPNPYKPHHLHNNCNCKQLFYTPLPNLPYAPCSTTVKMDDWFAPGTVQTCCSICPSINPIYTQSYPYTNNCCYKKY